MEYTYLPESGDFSEEQLEVFGEHIFKLLPRINSCKGKEIARRREVLNRGFESHVQNEVNIENYEEEEDSLQSDWSYFMPYIERYHQKRKHCFIGNEELKNCIHAGQNDSCSMQHTTTTTQMQHCSVSLEKLTVNRNISQQQNASCNMAGDASSTSDTTEISIDALDKSTDASVDVGLSSSSVHNTIREDEWKKCMHRLVQHLLRLSNINPENTLLSVTSKK